MSWRQTLRSRGVLASGAVLLIVLVIWGATLLAAARPRSLDDRVMDVASQLQCLPCQGESVADSPSSWATQVRGVIRQQLRSGKSEQQVIQYFVDRYGENIRQDPPKSGFTLLMWLGPLAALATGIALVTVVARQWGAAAASAARDPEDDEIAGLSDAELEPYRALLGADDATAEVR
ncbi:MAG TPA: cytochrome c-type biogenesis protein [Ktedonobacterales bacterium]|nr:cytochrome c-type biogenesis protein [Ktedonobacterales bacterium]